MGAPTSLASFVSLDYKIFSLFYKASNANFIEKCNKIFYWTSCELCIGCQLESTGRPVELLYWTSHRAEDLADRDTFNWTTY